MNEKNEEKRSIEWRIVTIVAIVIVVMICAFFAIRLFTENPIAGVWNSDDSSLVLSIKGDDMTASWDDLDGVKDIQLTLSHEMDKENRNVDIWVDDSELLKTEKSGIDSTVVQSEISALEGNFSYSIEGNELVLTEREYGDQVTFTKE